LTKGVGTTKIERYKDGDGRGAPPTVTNKKKIKEYTAKNH